MLKYYKETKTKDYLVVDTSFGIDLPTLATLGYKVEVK